MSDDRRLQGFVAKRLRDPYRPGERSSVKDQKPSHSAASLTKRLAFVAESQ
ncbi:MAG TPA: hypothetical protein VGT98_16085 [Candidatus Elarobacter sp.]|nr:hypothetical protein [Candidatus Elarobacter sp.]